MWDIVNFALAGHFPGRQVLAHSCVRLGVRSLVPHLPCPVQHLDGRSVNTAMCAFDLLHQVPVHQILALVKNKPGVASPERMNAGNKGHDHVIGVLMLEHIGSPKSTLPLYGFRQVSRPNIIPVSTVVLGGGDSNLTTIDTGYFL